MVCGNTKLDIASDEQYFRYDCKCGSFWWTRKDDIVQSRGLLLSTPLVKKVLSNEKDITRRVLLPPLYTRQGGYVERADKDNTNLDAVYWRRWNLVEKSPIKYQMDKLFKCPYGKPGELLYVRETWALMDDGDYVYKASWPDAAHLDEPEPKWKPSIHMPKWISRIWLEILDIRCEPLHKITKEEINREGINSADDFIKTWDDLNADRGYNYLSNPWVWVIVFKKLVPK
jgi:hypothetical protein